MKEDCYNKTHIDMSGKLMSADDKRLRAEFDADAMARVEEIMSDPSRRKMAINVAKQRASDLQKRAGVMQRVAGDSSAANKPSSGSRAKTQVKKK